MIEVRELSKVFDARGQQVRAVDNVTTQVAKGEVLVVIGPSGSGKSTTLVLRVVFMLCHVGIAPSQLTVISFTNASCAQLREQLLKLLAFWGYDFSANQARQCVRTLGSPRFQCNK